jgi:hypothetical protein
MTLTAMLPLSAYTDDTSGMWQRARRVMSFALGLGAAVVYVIAAWNTGAPLIVTVILSGIFGLLTGTGFGWIWTALMRKFFRWFVRRVYRLDPKTVAPPPGGRYVSYAPCSLRVSTYLSYGGVLYAGPDGLLFQPHRLLQPDSIKPVRIPARPLVLDCVVPPLTRLQSILIPRPIEFLHAKWDTGEASFFIPQPSNVIPKLQAALAVDAA